MATKDSTSGVAAKQGGDWAQFSMCFTTTDFMGGNGRAWHFNFQMDNNFMELPGAELCHLLWRFTMMNFNFWKQFPLISGAVSGTTFAHWAETLRSKNSLRTISWHGITCPNPIPKQFSVQGVGCSRRFGNRDLQLLERRLWKNLLASSQSVQEVTKETATIFPPAHSTSWRRRLRVGIKKSQSKPGFTMKTAQPSPSLEVSHTEGAVLTPQSQPWLICAQDQGCEKVSNWKEHPEKPTAESCWIVV